MVRVHADRARDADQRNCRHHRLPQAALVLSEMVHAETDAHRCGQIGHAATEEPRNPSGESVNGVECGHHGGPAGVVQTVERQGWRKWVLMTLKIKFYFLRFLVSLS